MHEQQLAGGQPPRGQVIHHRYSEGHTHPTTRLLQHPSCTLTPTPTIRSNHSDITLPVILTQ